MDDYRSCLPVVFYLSFPLAYMFLLPTLMYGDEHTIQALATLALILLTLFVLVFGILVYRSLLRAKRGQTYRFEIALPYFGVLLFIAYPLLFYSPFIEHSTFNRKISYTDALLINAWGGLFFFAGDLCINILTYRMQKNTLKGEDHTRHQV